MRPPLVARRRLACTKVSWRYLGFPLGTSGRTVCANDVLARASLTGAEETALIKTGMRPRGRVGGLATIP